MAWADIQSNEVYLYWGGIRRGMLRDSSGNLWAGYIEGGYNVQRPYIEKSADGGATWGSREDVSGIDDSRFCAMAIDSSDNIFVLYELDGTGIYVRKRSSGGGWSSPVFLTNDTNKGGIAIVVDSNDDIYVGILDGAGPDYFRLYKSTDGGLSFPLKASPLTQASSEAMGLAIGPTDNVHVVFGELYNRSTDGGTTWDGSEDTGMGPSESCTIVIDASDKPHVLKDDGHIKKIYYTNKVGASWSEILLADTGVTGEWEIFATLMMDRAGTLFALWCSGTYQESIAMRYSSNNGTTWSAKFHVYQGLVSGFELAWYPYSMSSIWPQIVGVSTNMMATGWNCIFWSNNWDTGVDSIKVNVGAVPLEGDSCFVA